jgi:hypothetical protein
MIESLKYRNFSQKNLNGLNQNIDQKADIWSKPSKDRKFFANSGYWGRRQVAKNGRIEVFRVLVEICPPLALTLYGQNAATLTHCVSENVIGSKSRAQQHKFIAYLKAILFIDFLWLFYH